MNPEEEQDPEEEQEEEYEEDYDDVSETQLQALLEQGKRTADLERDLQAFSGPKDRDSNFLHVQISTDELLSKLENFYRGRYESLEGNNRVMKQTKDKRLRMFNEFGVSSMMEVISKYLDKNTTLSNYQEERIYEIIADIGDELVLLILSNYEPMGLDTYEKKTKFRLIIATTCHIIESAYRRALRGQTLNKLNESKAIHQFETNDPRAQNPQKKMGLLQRYLG